MLFWNIGAIKVYERQIGGVCVKEYVTRGEEEVK